MFSKMTFFAILGFAICGRWCGVVMRWPHRSAASGVAVSLVLLPAWRFRVFAILCCNFRYFREVACFKKCHCCNLAFCDTDPCQMYAWGYTAFRDALRGCERADRGRDRKKEEERKKGKKEEGKNGPPPQHFKRTGKSESGVLEG